MKHFVIFILLLFLLSSCKADKKEVINKPVLEIEKDTIIPEPKIDKDFLLGKFDYKTHSDFVQVDLKLSSKRVYLQNETYDAFLKMQRAAQYDTIQLIIICLSVCFPVYISVPYMYETTGIHQAFSR